MEEVKELTPFVSGEKLGQDFGWTKGQIRGYQDKYWTRNVQFALIAGRIMFNPQEIIRWQHSEVSAQRAEESKSDGSMKASSIPDLSTKRRRKQTSKMRLGSVKSSLSYAN